MGLDTILQTLQKIRNALRTQSISAQDRLEDFDMSAFVRDLYDESSVPLFHGHEIAELKSMHDAAVFRVTKACNDLREKAIQSLLRDYLDVLHKVERRHRTSTGGPVALPPPIPSPYAPIQGPMVPHAGYVPSSRYDPPVAPSYAPPASREASMQRYDGYDTNDALPPAPSDATTYESVRSGPVSLPAPSVQRSEPWQESANRFEVPRASLPQPVSNSGSNTSIPALPVTRGPQTQALPIPQWTSTYTNLEPYVSSLPYTVTEPEAYSLSTIVRDSERQGRTPAQTQAVLDYAAQNMKLPSAPVPEIAPRLPNAGYETGPSNNGYETAPTNAGYETDPSNNGYETAPTNAGYESASSNARSNDRANHGLLPNTNDPYAILGVSKNASASELRQAYLNAARRTHSNKGGSNAAFRKVKNAYDRLRPLHTAERNAPSTNGATNRTNADPSEPVYSTEDILEEYEELQPYVGVLPESLTEPDAIELADAIRNADAQGQTPENTQALVASMVRGSNANVASTIGTENDSSVLARESLTRNQATNQFPDLAPYADAVPPRLSWSTAESMVQRIQTGEANQESPGRILTDVRALGRLPLPGPNGASNGTDAGPNEGPNDDGSNAADAGLLPNTNDPYAILGVSKNASASELRKAYLNAARRTHSNKGGSNAAFRKVKNAYDRLRPLHTAERNAPSTNASAPEGPVPTNARTNSNATNTQGVVAKNFVRMYPQLQPYASQLPSVVTPEMGRAIIEDVRNGSEDGASQTDVKNRIQNLVLYAPPAEPDSGFDDPPSNEKTSEVNSERFEPTPEERTSWDQSPSTSRALVAQQSPMLQAYEDALPSDVPQAMVPYLEQTVEQGLQSNRSDAEIRNDLFRLTFPTPHGNVESLSNGNQNAFVNAPNLPPGIEPPSTPSRNRTPNAYANAPDLPNGTEPPSPNQLPDPYVNAPNLPNGPSNEKAGAYDLSPNLNPVPLNASSPLALGGLPGNSNASDQTRLNIEDPYTGNAPNEFDPPTHPMIAGDSNDWNQTDETILRSHPLEFDENESHEDVYNDPDSAFQEPLEKSDDVWTMGDDSGDEDWNTNGNGMNGGGWTNQGVQTDPTPEPSPMKQAGVQTDPIPQTPMKTTGAQTVNSRNRTGKPRPTSSNGSSSGPNKPNGKANGKNANGKNANRNVSSTLPPPPNTGNLVQTGTTQSLASTRNGNKGSELAGFNTLARSTNSDPESDTSHVSFFNPLAYNRWKKNQNGTYTVPETKTTGASDPYQVLGITANASDDEIKSAYKAMSLKRHPNKGGSTEAFRNLKNAYNRIRLARGM